MHVMIYSYMSYLQVQIEQISCKPALLSTVCQNHVCVLITEVGWTWPRAKDQPSCSLSLTLLYRIRGEKEEEKLVGRD